jgi:hypothetical protein
MKYDLIGDIHGHYNDLQSLLLNMGYGQSEKGHYYHPDRQVIFVGDYIDRGKYSREVVRKGLDVLVKYAELHLPNFSLKVTLEVIRDTLYS